MQKGVFGEFGQWQPYLESSGQVVSFELPSVPSGHYSGQIVIGENAGASSPQPVTVYGSISQCPGIISANHTRVPEAMGGRGVAGTLLNFMLEDARTNGFKIVPVCPYVRGQYAKHPEWADLFTTRTGEDP
ncbi:MAG: hypothetical protein B7Z22_10880 [Hyphomonas sp. 32-62-5]|nr:MAG: hypothetical protein B7Z22_10880 [Hyphomonas sp. 32-62-5]